MEELCNIKDEGFSHPFPKKPIVSFITKMGNMVGALPRRLSNGEACLWGRWLTVLYKHSYNCCQSSSATFLPLQKRSVCLCVDVVMTLRHTAFFVSPHVHVNLLDGRWCFCWVIAASRLCVQSPHWTLACVLCARMCVSVHDRLRMRSWVCLCVCTFIFMTPCPKYVTLSPAVLATCWWLSPFNTLILFSRKLYSAHTAL